MEGPACVMFPAYLGDWGRMGDEYILRIVGGRVAARITIPVIGNDDIAKAADALELLSARLKEISLSRDKKITKILSARSAIHTAHKALKPNVRVDGRPTYMEVAAKAFAGNNISRR